MGCGGGWEDCAVGWLGSGGGGIISAWNIRVVGSEARVVMALAMSEGDMAGNSST